MSFVVPGDAYDRFVGRYSRLLAPRFVDFARVGAGPVLDLGCGPGALTAELAARHGADRTAAVDPSEPFVAACRARVPGADVRLGAGEALPFPDAHFGGVLSQLVLSFVKDPGRTISEVRRVLRPGGVVAVCSFEERGFELARTFWEVALKLDPAAPDDARLPFRHLEPMLALLRGAGFSDVSSGLIEFDVGYEGFDALFEPLLQGVGPPGAWLAAQPEPVRAAMREGWFERLGRPTGPFSLHAMVLAVRGVA
ncbi:MAG: class I SAM-dependent methyltransferase [Anaeromyxobacter sp.]